MGVRLGYGVNDTDGADMSPSSIRLGMAVFVTMLWAIGYLIAILQQNYDGVIPATPVMLIAAAYLFSTGSSDWRRNGHRNGHSNGGGS